MGFYPWKGGAAEPRATAATDSMNAGTIIIAVLMFSLLIFVHELGHFLAAKWSGIRVNEFALGMGPKLLSHHRGETTYSIRAFPIGGFCAMEGEDEESDEPGAFAAAPLYKRLITMVAGAAMNLLLGLLIVGVLVSRMPMFGSTVVAEFRDGATSGAYLQVGDVITRMNGNRVRTLNDVNYEFGRVRDGQMPIEVLRDGQTLRFDAVPFPTQNMEGIDFVTMDFKVQGVEKTFLSSVQYTFNMTISLIKQVWGSLVDLVTGRYGISQLSGPVGVTKVISQATKIGWENLFYIVAVISLNLGIFNMLPLPALDGGRVIFLLVELVRRKPVDPKYEGLVHAVGFVLLIGLMILVTINDIFKL